MPNRRRGQVLSKSNNEVAKELKASPGQWFLIAAGGLERQRVLAQTAYRIRQNYREGKGLSAFAADSTGEFEAVSTADQSRPNQLAPVELRARWLSTGCGQDVDSQVED